jgi:starch synthase
VARVETLQGLDLVAGRHEYSVDIWRARLPGSTTPVYLVESDALYARPTLYTSDADEHRRFLILTRAALECCRRMNFRPHIVHSHDWHTAFAPLWLRSIYKTTRYSRGEVGHDHPQHRLPGAIQRSRRRRSRSRPDAYLLHQDDLKAGQINALKHGILHADAVTTVSPTYAARNRHAALRNGHGAGTRVTRQRGARHLNGVDYEEWDPRNDKYLPIHFGPGESTRKAELKRNFCCARA